MFGKLFGQLAVPFLLASTLQNNDVNQQRQQQSIPQPLPQATSSIPTDTTSTASSTVAITTTSTTGTTYTSLKDIRTGMNQIYQDLVDNPGNVTKRVSDTMQFSYVSPLREGISTWRTSSLNGVTMDANINTSSDINNSDNKPLAIYLPGLDGTGISAFTHQFDDLATTFDLWRLIITTKDRSDFRHLLKAVMDFVDSMPPHQEIVLIGESFGGVLASAVALQLEKKYNNTATTKSNPVKGLVLVNPATAFHDTNWDTIVPLLASLQYLNNSNSTNPTPYSVAGGMALSYLMPSNDQLGQLVELLTTVLGNSAAPLEETLEDMMGLLEILEERLPAATLQHRVSQWLGVGTHIVNERLSTLQTPTLVLAGDQDRVMPSAKEVDRLVRVLPNCEKLLVRGKGHFVLDETVNLTEAILYSKIDPLYWKTYKDNGNKDDESKSTKKKRRYDPIYDWSLPPKEEVASIIQSQVQPLRNIHSPVFFSTDEKGKRWRGLAKIPYSNRNDEQQGPILFVANHQFFGLDLSMIVAELLEERNLICRGLGHPVLFNQTREFPELQGRTPGLRRPAGGGGGGGVNSPSNFQSFGAVEVTPRNYYKLLQSGQNGLLFPGGVKDVFQTDPSYPLLWPEKPDFVRTAARFNATIVPLSAVGMLESARVLLETKDLANVPFLGQRVRDAGGFPAARYDAPAGERDPLPPIPFPSMPQRNYFVFGKPFRTHDIDPRDKDACAILYKEVVEETRRGLDDIFEARKQDPFSDTPRRIAYEQITRKKAPTFGLDRLNNAGSGRTK